MFCSTCGQAIQPGQQACANCGKPVVFAPPVGVPRAFYTRVERHIQTVGILWLVYAGIGLLGYLVALPFLAGMFGAFGHHMGPFGPMGGNFPFVRMPFLLPFISFFIIVRAALQIIAGIGLLHRAPWGRIMAVVVSFLSVLKIPLGTALAIYTLWVLLPASSGQEYEELSQP